MARKVIEIQVGPGIPVGDLDVVAAIRQAQREQIAQAVAEKLEAKRKAEERLKAHQAAVAAQVMAAAADRREQEAQKRRDSEEAHYRNDARKRFEAAGGRPCDFEATWPALWRNHLADKAQGKPGLEPDLRRVWRPHF